MKYAIVFSSRTGNTAQLAGVLKECMPQADCVYFGAPDEQALAANVVFVGFWTDKGGCDEAAKAFLKTMKAQRLFLFGTAGFGGDAAYFEKVLNAAKANVDTTVPVIGEFMCQGKMPASILARYEKMLADGADRNHIQGMIDCFHSATTHPDQTDLENLKDAVGKIAKECSDETKN